MSYIRMNEPLIYFKGYSTAYVFPASTNGTDHFVQDYNDKYKDNKTFADILCRMTYRATGDERYTWKIAGILAKKFKIKRRPHPLTSDEWEKESNTLSKKLEKEKTCRSK